MTAKIVQLADHRSSRREVRNPVLALPASRALRDLPLDSRMALAMVLHDLARDARERADKCWRRHKAPMAAYWYAISVYANHTRRVLISGRIAR